jgi:N-methylhydantoinase A
MPRHNRQPKELRVAIDTGGTFTDCVWFERGRIRMLKVFSTPADPSEGIIEALAKARVNGTATLLHGTTVGTNTLLQRKGARVALVTTAGFEDVIEIGRQARPKLYDLFFDKIEPLVPAELRFGVKERVASNGRILERPSVNELRTLASKVRSRKAEAVAVCLLFSFANRQNEQAVARALQSLKVPLSISHLILPEFREYERTSTVVVNAYLQPVMQQYFAKLDRRLGKAQRVELQPRTKARFFVMQSSGGITTSKSAAREPVRTVLSGPAGGVVGAAAMARRSGFDRIISFDMGGTSTDVALVDRAVRAGNQTTIAGLPVGVPMVDIHTVGAGGGSIARFDAGGALRVGPESAGADPGPICYGRGTQPTVTDANLILGSLLPDRFLGGDFTLDVQRTRRIVTEWLKKTGSRLTLEQFAAGVIRVVNATMERAIRVVSIERGYDPREFALVAFGGAGGLHACELAEALGIPRVIVPALPGALSAFGILASDVVKDYSRTVLWRVNEKLPSGRLSKEFDVLRRQAERDFHEEGWKGSIHYALTVDTRYRGQGYELNIPYGPGLIAAFRREHQRRYGYNYDRREIELVTLRLQATVKSPRLFPASGQFAANTSRGSFRESEPQSSPIFFGGRKISATVLAREGLRSGKKHFGPAVICEYSATTFVPPHTRFWVDRAGNLIVAARPPV